MTSYPPRIAALLALVGCADQSSDPEPPGPRTIVAREALTFRGADGASTSLPVDLGRAVIQVVARGDNGGLAIYPGEGTHDGTLVVRDVPSGPAMLRVDYFDGSAEPRVRNEYFALPETGDVELDLGTWRAGRPDLQRAITPPTELAVQMSGLAPWRANEDLAVIYAPNLGFVNVFTEDVPGAIIGMPATGATASTLRIDWASALFAPLARADRGDRAWMMQFRFRAMGGDLVGAPVRATELPPFTQHDGQRTEVAAALAEPAPLRVRVAMDRDAFDELRRFIHPRAGLSDGRGFAISSSPSVVTEEMSLESVPAELVVIDSNGVHGRGPYDLGDLDVASPFPIETVFGRFVSQYPVELRRPDGFVPIAHAEIGAMTHELPTQAAPAAPLIGPVTAVTVNGQDAFGAPRGVGAAPVIAWEPPALGTPSAYEVSVLGPGGDDERYGYGWFPVAVFHVPGDATSVQLPPELLDPTFPYAIAIRAIAQPRTGEQLLAAPRQLALPYGWADAITPAFQP